MQKRWPLVVGVFLSSLIREATAIAAGCPSSCGDAAHTGDAADETLQLPLGLVAQVKARRRRVDLRRRWSRAAPTSSIRWARPTASTRAPDRSSGRLRPTARRRWAPTPPRPCVVERPRLLTARPPAPFTSSTPKDGKVIKTLHIGSPIVSAPTFANDCDLLPGARRRAALPRPGRQRALAAGTTTPATRNRRS